MRTKPTLHSTEILVSHFSVALPMPRRSACIFLKVPNLFSSGVSRKISIQNEDDTGQIVSQIAQLIKQNFGLSKGPWFMASKNFSTLVERDNQNEQFFKWLSLRFEKRGSKTAELRAFNPFIATQSGPGGGKTYFLSHLSTFSDQVMKSFPKGIHSTPKFSE